MTMKVGDSSEDVRTLKQKLREGGYFEGPDDAYFGEDLANAVRAYQTAHGLTVDGVVGPETWGNIHGDPRYPNNSTGALGGAPSGGGGGGDMAEIKKRYPQFAYLIDDPEMGAILREDARRALAGDPMPPNEFEAAVMATNWWRTTSASAREYYNLQFADPASFNDKIRDYSDTVRTIGGQLGYDETVLTPQYVSHFANRAYREGLTPAQIKAIIADEITPLIGPSEKGVVLSELRGVMQAYHYKIDDSSLHYWAREIGSGRQSIDNFRNTVKLQMRGMFPHLANFYDQGMTQREILAPYKEILSKEFDGKNPEDFDFGDAKWRHVIDYVDEKTGVHRTMSMQELQKYARSQPEWRNTNNAKKQVAEIGEQLLQSFGAVK